MKYRYLYSAVAVFSFLAAASVSCSGSSSDSEENKGYPLEKTLYVMTTASLVDSTSTPVDLVWRGDSLDVLGYDSLGTDGRPVRYYVRHGSKAGFIYGRYTRDSLHKAVAPYLSGKIDSVHKAVKNRWKGGLASGCDFYPHQRPEGIYKGMPSPCNTFYLNISPGNLKAIDRYIALADSTKINAFVIDIKDNECPGYKAEAMQKYSPTNYSHASATQHTLYKEVVDKLHARGYWVIGRITCFKDTYYAKDHPESCISQKEDGTLFFHNKSYWPSAYDRGVWRFNVELAKESVLKLGFDEINFDYVRFPDGLISRDETLNYHNRYKESKVQAIQNFVRYATDELHAIGVPVSIDVFGESANPGYTTAYGQYWPAISNIADVICAMPYPDHFADNYYGISKPWNHPYEILHAWGKRAKGRQGETSCPARVRTWIQAYHVMRHVDPNGIDNDSDYIRNQVRGLYDAGLRDGYLTWNASGTIKIYRKQKSAYATNFAAQSNQ